MTHHLMIVTRRYIAAILKGKKTVECRLSKTPKPPFGRVKRGDTLWIKLSGGPVVADTRVRRVTYFHPVTPAVLQAISTQYGRLIRAKPGFYNEHREANYATLILLDRVTPLDPFRIDKRDRRAWVVLPVPPQPTSSPLRQHTNPSTRAV